MNNSFDHNQTLGQTVNSCFIWMKGTLFSHPGGQRYGTLVADGKLSSGLILSYPKLNLGAREDDFADVSNLFDHYQCFGK